jgi:hypothetical protein
MKLLKNKFVWGVCAALALAAIPLVWCWMRYSAKYCKTNGVYDWDEELDWLS